MTNDMSCAQFVPLVNLDSVTDNIAVVACPLLFAVAGEFSYGYIVEVSEKVRFCNRG